MYIATSLFPISTSCSFVPTYMLTYRQQPLNLSLFMGVDGLHVACDQFFKLQSTTTQGWRVEKAAVPAYWRWSARTSGGRWAAGSRGVQTARLRLRSFDQESWQFDRASARMALFLHLWRLRTFTDGLRGMERVAFTFHCRSGLLRWAYKFFTFSWWWLELPLQVPGM